ncbi:MAG: LysR family transcriptional regulator, partial [Firmicutes bacterium]|nr:LysR family transcriptional regulator [Bacillota bacterium]
MNIKQIEGFCYLAQTLNFSKAAEKMYITQPAFSRMIVNLEKELGCQLFVRSKASPKLTLAGEQIYEHMKAIRREYEDICAIARLAEQKKLGNLRIGMLDNGLTEHSLKLINAFSEDHKAFSLELKEYSEAEIFHALEMEWIDIAFLVHFPESYREKMDGIVSEVSRECVVIHKSHPLAQKNAVGVGELKDVPFVMLRESKSDKGYNHVMTQCLSHGFSPYIAMKADSVAGALSAVDCNLGCTILTDSLQHLAGSNVVFVPIENSKPCEHWVVWKKDSTNPYVSEFSESLKKCIQ